MFEYRLSRFSPGLFVLQLFAVPPSCLLGGLVAYEAFLGAGRENLWREMGAYLVFAVIGLVLGQQVHNRAPDAAGSGGKWIWVVPVCLVWGVVSESSRGFFEALADFFAPSLDSRQGAGENGLVWVLFTLPACACICYSVTLAKLDRNSNPRTAVRGLAAVI